MRIIQYAEGDAPGGTERLLIQICLELRRRGHEVLTFGPTDGVGKGWLRGELGKLGFEWVSHPRRSQLDPRHVRDVVRVLRRFDADVIHAHEFAPAVFGTLGAWLTGRRSVISLHSNMYFAGAWRRRAALKWAIGHSVPVAVAADTQKDVERVLGLEPGTVKVIPNGIASQPGKREPLRAELGLRPDELLVVAIGNLSARKAHVLMVQALAELERRRPGLPWRFAVGGTDQGEAGKIQALAKEHGLEQRVHLLGHRSDTEDVLAAADVFAMSSLHEGMPLAIMEAMFAGLPIVTSTAGGIGEMLVDGSEGLLVPVGEAAGLSLALERVLADPALRERLGTAAKARAAKQFGIGPMVDAYLRCYQGAEPAREG